MKAKKILIGLICAAAITAAGLIWWHAPVSIINIKPTEVSKIKIFDGSTGKEMVITSAAEIEHIIKNLNAVTLEKQKISLFYLGYGYKTTIYTTDGAAYKEFMINSNSTIRKDPFFYQDRSESIDCDYIQGLFD